MDSDKMGTEKQVKEFYEMLNKSQQQAVNEIEGPVLVIAGPGTGKTQMLASRIVNILEKTDTNPENIMCLTYTDAGTIAMRSRLIDFIGSEAYRIPVFTFHAFCNRVIQDNPEYFGLRSLDPVSELEQRIIAREIVDSFDGEHPLKRYGGEIYHEAARLIDLWSVMKREDWNEVWLKEKIAAYKLEIATKDEFIYKKDSKYGKKGELKPAYHDEIKRMDKLIAAVDTYPLYNSKLQESGRYDFADMILWVIRAFKENPSLLLRYQEIFQYILVDEFQDTSGSQNHLLDLLLNFWETPNVFCVGDEDQSIYRFQGANVENISEFVKRYNPKRISLSENYRSSQEILNASNLLIKHNQIRLDADKKLEASGKYKNADVIKPRIFECQNPLQENAIIAKEIEQLLASGTSGNEIAVLYRKHQHSDELVTYFQKKGILVNVRKSVNILEEPLIINLITILKYLAAENKKPHSGEMYLFELLHFSCFGLNPLRIAELSLKLSRANFNERNNSWREELKRGATAKQDLFTTQNEAGQFIKVSELIESWIKSTYNETTAVVIEKVINESGILSEALTSEDKSWNMQLLHSFFEFVKSESSRQKKLTLNQLIEVIKLMEEEGVRINAEKLISAEKGINFLTIYGAKGLEFEHVYIINCNSNKWERGRDANNGYKLPENLFDIISSEDDEELRRLFYVGMTRAKRHLTISFSKADNNGKELERSRFVNEISESESSILIKDQITEDAFNDYLKVLIGNKFKADDKSLFDNELVDQILKDYSLSVTHLSSYLRCPTAFYFNNLIRVPAQMNASLTFGSAVHHALEQLFKKMNQNESHSFPNADELVTDFKWYMRKNEDKFTEREFQLRMEYGEKVLPAYYNNYIEHWNKITSVERTYRNIVLEDVPLNGKLDKLEFDGLKVNVVDYKTGKSDNGVKKLSPPDSAKKVNARPGAGDKNLKAFFGGDYWRQAVFYKLLIDHDKTSKYQVQSVEFDFIEPNEKSEFVKRKVSITPDDEMEVTNQIKLVYHSIKNKEFSQGCNEDECEWCSFVKNYYAGKKTSTIITSQQTEVGD